MLGRHSILGLAQGGALYVEDRWLVLAFVDKCVRGTGLIASLLALNRGYLNYFRFLLLLNLVQFGENVLSCGHRVLNTFCQFLFLGIDLLLLESFLGLVE